MIHKRSFGNKSTISILRIVFSIFLMVLIFAFYPKDELITIHLVGDSTMSVKKEKKRPETGWGEMLSSHFKANIRVLNHAKNGRSTKTFRQEGWWDEVMANLSTGDYVLLQFGHNDGKKNSPRFASPDDYKRNLKRYIHDIRSKKAEALLLTPVMRRRFTEEGKFYDTHAEYPNKVRELANEMNTPLIDMHALSQELLTKLGAEASKELFLWLEVGDYPNYPEGLTDNTHFSPEGARMIAELFVNELKTKQHPLLKHLK